MDVHPTKNGIFIGILIHTYLENRPLQCPRCDTDWDKLLDVLEARVNSEDIVAFSACFYCMQWCPLAKHGDPLKRDKGLEQKWDWRTSCSCNQERIYWYDIYIYMCIYIMYVLHFFYVFFKHSIQNPWISINIQKLVCNGRPTLSHTIY